MFCCDYRQDQFHLWYYPGGLHLSERHLPHLDRRYKCPHPCSACHPVLLVREPSGGILLDGPAASTRCPIETANLHRYWGAVVVGQVDVRLSACADKAGDLCGETRREIYLYCGAVIRLVEVQGPRLGTPYDAGFQIGIVRRIRILLEMEFAMRARLSPNARCLAMYHSAPGAACRDTSHIIAGNLLVSLPGCRCCRRYSNPFCFVMCDGTVITGRPVVRGLFVIRENKTMCL